MSHSWLRQREHCVCVCVCFNDLSSSTTLGINEFQSLNSSLPKILGTKVLHTAVKNHCVVKKKFSVAHSHPCHPSFPPSKRLNVSYTEETWKFHCVAIIHNCASEVSWAPNKQTNQKTRIHHILFMSESGFLEVWPGLFLISGSWWVSAKHTCEHSQKWAAGRNSIHIFNLFITYLTRKRFMASNKYLKYNRIKINKWKI